MAPRLALHVYRRLPKGYRHDHTLRKIDCHPVNLRSSELISIYELVSMVKEIAGVKLKWNYELDSPRGVSGRNSDNTFIQSIMEWEPNIPLHTGMQKAFAWIEQQYYDRKAGKKVVQESSGSFCCLVLQRKVI